MDHRMLRKKGRLPGKWLWKQLPEMIANPLRLRVEEFYRTKSVQPEAILKEEVEDYWISQCTRLIYGLFLLMILAIMTGIFSGNSTGKDILVIRNSYGKGEKQMAFSLQQGEASTEIQMTVQEQNISREASQKQWNRFYKELKKRMKGKNPSLQEVNQKLYLPEQIKGYPFHIQYQIADPDYIGYDGHLGEKARKLKKGSLKTSITVIASYKENQKEKTFPICLIAAKKKETPFSDIVKEMQKQEKESRGKKSFYIPGKVQGAIVGESGQKNPLAMVLFLGFVVLVIFLLRSYYSLKEAAQKAKESAIEDFTTLVHLITLYMGAGLSFSRAMHRISRDYSKGILTDGEARYAFEQIKVISQQLQMGVSQKEACQQWGQRMNVELYRKLSVVLVQCLSKGSTEVKAYLGQMEQEAFRLALDRGKKKGEEASTKMILPMIILMAAVMILVMFPALMQMQSY